MFKQLVTRISKTRYVQTAIAERADLAAFKEKPTKRIIIGLILIGFSYIIGWPAVGALGILSIYMEEPLMVVVGGPVVYGLSHLVFVMGAYLAGAEYAKVFFRWAVRVSVEKLMGRPVSPNLENEHPPGTRG